MCCIHMDQADGGLQTEYYFSGGDGKITWGRQKVLVDGIAFWT